MEDDAMAIEFFRAISPLEIRVRPRRAGENVLIGDPRIAGDWIVTYSSPRDSVQVSRTRKGMIEEIEAAGFEYVPQKRIYRRP